VELCPGRCGIKREVILNGKTEVLESDLNGRINVFVIRPEIKTLEMIKKITRKCNDSPRFIFIPRRTNECDEFIRDNLSKDTNEFKIIP
jgi:hypothetical protein